MEDNRHRIRSIRWEGTSGSNEEAFWLRGYLRHEGTELFFAVAEQAFDEAVGRDTVLHIPRIEIRLRVDPTKGVTDEEKRALLASLREQLYKEAEHANSPDLLPPEKRPLAASRLDILLHFLQTGSLPWHAEGEAGPCAADLTDTALEQLDTVIRRLSTTLSGDSTAPWLRLLHLLPESGLSNCITLLTAPIATDELRSGVTTLLTEQELAPSEWLEIRKFLETLPQGIRELLRIPAGTANQKFTAEVQVDACEDVMRVPEITALSHQLQKEFEEQERSQSQFQPQPGNDSRPTEAGNVPMPDDQPQATQDLFPILVQNAGLMLLVPFIPRFFANCGVIDGDSAAIRPNSLSRAAALLHYLVRGEWNIHEFQLPLVKVLLGLHPTFLLPVREGQVRDVDAEEAEALLASAITHWSALKNTSINGLRATFIQRQGLLREDEDGWQLTVERTAVDILLERIPWAFGMSRLPWMKKSVFVQW